VLYDKSVNKEGKIWKIIFFHLLERGANISMIIA